MTRRFSNTWRSRVSSQTPWLLCGQRIDSAKVYSDLDQDIYELYETWHFSYGRLDTPLEELVDQTISSIEMTLAE